MPNMVTIASIVARVTHFMSTQTYTNHLYLVHNSQQHVRHQRNYLLYMRSKELFSWNSNRFAPIPLTFYLRHLNPFSRRTIVKVSYPISIPYYPNNLIRTNE